MSTTRSPEADGLAHVVGDEDDRLAGLLPDPVQVVVELIARDGVEGGERLIHEQQLELLGERAGQRTALAHAARELMRPVIGEVDQPDHGEQAVDRLVALVGSSLWMRIGSSTLRRTVSQGSSAGSWNITAGRPSAISIVPEVTLSRPAISESRVDLPHPEAPRMQTNSPLVHLQRHVLERGHRALAVAEHLRDPVQGHEGVSASSVTTEGRGASARFISRAIRR